MNSEALHPSDKGLIQPIELVVSLVLSAQFDASVVASIRTALLARTTELAEDFQLPANIRLDARQAKRDQLPEGQVFSLEVGGKPCRIEQFISEAEYTLEDQVAVTLFRNRAHLVTEELVAAVCQGPLRSFNLQPHRPRGRVVHKILKEAFQRCLNLCAGLKLCRVSLEDNHNKGNLEYAFELTADRTRSDSVQLLLGKKQFAAAMQPAAESQPGVKYRIDEMGLLMRDGLFYEIGMWVPTPDARFDATLAPCAFRFRFNHVRGPVYTGLSDEHVLVNDTVDRLHLLNIDGTSKTNPAQGNEVALVTVEDAERCEQAGLVTWDAAGYLILYLSSQLRHHAAELYSVSHTENSLSLLNQAFPILVFNTLERFSVVEITNVLRGLLAEGLSIRDLRTILESLLSTNGTTDVDTSTYIVFTSKESDYATSPYPIDKLTTQDRIEIVRRALKSYISHKFTRGQSAMLACLLTPELEKLIVDSRLTPLSDAQRHVLIANVKSELANAGVQHNQQVILTTEPVRYRLHALLAMEFPRLPVLSYAELSPELNIQPVARIGF